MEHKKHNTPNRPTTWLYIIKLSEGKFYVGTTVDLSERLENHWNGNAAAWTKKYPPEKVVAVYHNKDLFDEDRKVKELMSKFGIDNVRGGTYSLTQLPAEQIKFLQREIYHGTGRCLECGSKTHWVNDCPNKKKKRAGFEGISECDERIKDEISLVSSSDCTRCGRNTHNVSECYAKTHLKGYPLANISAENIIEKQVIDREVIVERDCLKVISVEEKPNNVDVEVNDVIVQDDPEIAFIKWALYEYSKVDVSSLPVHAKNFTEGVINILPSSIDKLKFSCNEDPVFQHIVKSVQLVISDEFINVQTSDVQVYIGHIIPLLESFLNIKLGKTSSQTGESSKTALVSSLIDLSTENDENKANSAYCTIQ